MNKILHSFRKVLTPVTIMVIPHGNVRPLNIQIPTVFIIFTLFLSAIGGFHAYSLMQDGLKYPGLLKRVDFYNRQFSQWNSTVSSLQKIEEDFRRIFTLNSRDKILETIDPTSIGDHASVGSVDIQNLMADLQKKTETMEEMKDYLRVQKDIYRATPKGYPVSGRVTSCYGKREDPFSHAPGFHSGIDISHSPGAPIRASADGVVGYSGWTPHSGFVVIIKHPLGFSTAYAHNMKNTVRVGQRVKRGDVVGYVGSTGKSTGPHVHYEIWKEGNPVDPRQFLG